jgi:hypothetical protein
MRASVWAAHPIPARTEAAIRAALAEPGHPGVRKIAARFGVDPGTVQRISRPFRGRKSHRGVTPTRRRL